MRISLRRRRLAAVRGAAVGASERLFRTAIEPLEERRMLSVTPVAGTVADLISDINADNAAGGTHTISLTQGATFDFTAANNDWYGPNALPAITCNLTIDGNGATLQRDAAGSTPKFRFFYVSGGLSGLSAGSLTLNNLTLTNGLAKGGDSNQGGGGLGAGGAIFNQGTLDLNGVTIENSKAQGGKSGNTSVGNGGGGIGQDAPASGNGGGFGSLWTGGFGAAGAPGNPATGQGGGGGGFTSGTDNGNISGAGGGQSALGSNLGDAGNGASAFVQGYPPAAIQGGNGGNFGSGGGAVSAIQFAVAPADITPDTIATIGGGGGGGVGGGGGTGVSLVALPPGVSTGDTLAPLGVAVTIGGGGGGGGFGGGGAANGGVGGFGGGSAGLGGEGLGGAIFNMFGTATLVNTTIANNTAAGGADSKDANSANGEGGGIYSLDGTVNIKFITFGFNTVSGGTNTNGGSVYIGSFGDTVDGGAVQDSELHAASTIFANSTGGAEDIVEEAVGAAHTNTALMDFQTPCLTDTTIEEINNFGSSDVTGTINTGNPKLGTLGNYGGFTPTIPLGSSSDALGKGTADASVARDQRGALRASAPDMGSFEVVTSVVVTTNTDEDDGTTDPSFGTGTSLREAVNFANLNPGGATITFDPSLAGDTIAFSTIGDGTAGPSALGITNNVNIQGLGGNSGITLSGGGSNSDMRAFYVGATGHLTLQNLTLQSFRHQGGDSGAGGAGAGLGGAIFVNGGKLDLVASTLTGNIAQGGDANDLGIGGGGGLGGDGYQYNGGPPNGSVTSGDFSSDPGFGGGGGDNTVSSNGGFGGGGGGFGADGGFGGGGGGSFSSPAGRAGFGGGPGSANSSTGGHGGSGAGMGGAIFQNGGTVNIINSTLTANSAFRGHGGFAGFGYGGAVFNRDGSLTITNSTLARNAADDRGPEIYNLGDGDHSGGDPITTSTATATINNTILGTFLATDGVTTPDIVKQAINGGTSNATGTTNAIQNPNGFTGTGTISSGIKLDSLKSNGGPTQTMALLSGSTAVNAGTNSLAVDASNSPLTTDQRGSGFPRTVLTKVDIGAYEFNSFNESLVVTTATDEDNGTSDPAFGTGTSLREAINYADTLTGTQTITFDPTAFPSGSLTTIKLTLGALEAKSSSAKVVIDSPALGQIEVNGNNTSNVFQIDSGENLEIDNLIIDGGNNNSGNGGGIYNAGSLTLKNDEVNSNTALDGGGIYSDLASTLSITGGTVSDNISLTAGGGIDTLANIATLDAVTMILNNAEGNNSGGGFGGGIFQQRGTLTIKDGCIIGGTSTEKGNTAEAEGGGIAVINPAANTFLELNVSDSLIQHNSAAQGGGIYLYQGKDVSQLTADIFDCTIDGNTSTFYGGGIVARTGSSVTGLSGTLRKSTVSNNTAGDDGGGLVIDAPEEADNTTFTIANTTISGNTADGSGGGIWAHSVALATTDLNIFDSTIANNTADADGNGGDSGGGLFTDLTSPEKPLIDNTIISGNFVGKLGTADDFAGSNTGSANFIGGNAMLAPLGNYGGPTFTMIPLPGSPVINDGDNTLIPVQVTTDQRGQQRVADTTVDVGAVEIQPVNTVTTIVPSSGPYNPGQQIMLTITVTVPTVNNPGDNTGAPIGEVKIFDGANLVDTVNLNTSSQAKSIKVFASGAHSFTAQYEGDHVHNPSLSDPAKLTVLTANKPPVAKADSANTAPSTAVTVNVLANDSDPQGKALHVSAITTNPAHGSVSIVNNQIKYTPNNNFFGQDTFVYKVTDSLNLSSTAKVTITVGNGAGVGKDPDNSLTDLYFVGTPNPDTIVVKFDGAQGKAFVTINGVTKGPFSFTGRIIGYGLDGSDKITIDPLITRQAVIHGGDGNDTINGGGGNDILFGDNGNDQLFGNGGRDILIGGQDGDSVSGGAGDDILIAGSTTFDNNLADMDAIDKEWVRTDETYTQRENHLVNGGGQNVVGSTAIKLNANTVTSAPVPSDTSTGGADADLFYSNLTKIGGVGDIITDKAGSEIVVSVHG